MKGVLMMRVKQSSLVLLNLLSRSVICGVDRWHEEGEELRKLALESGVYPNGPLVMTIGGVKNEPELREYGLFLPLSSPVEGPAGRALGFRSRLCLRKTAAIRHYEADEPFAASYRELENAAYRRGIILERPFYHVCLEVNGERFFDIHAPIKGSAA